MVIWVASSRVLLKIRMGSTPPGVLLARLRSRRSQVGMQKPNVLPVPVLALASTSLPARQCGRHASCTGVSADKPRSSNARTSGSLTPASLTAARGEGTV